MLKSVAQIDREIAALQETRAQAVKAEEAIRALSPDQQAAIVLHDNLCHANHEDSCGWYYEVAGGRHDFTKPSHARWLHTAQQTMNRLNALELTPVVKIAVIEAVTAR